MNQQVVADAVPLHIESTTESLEPALLRVLGFSPEAARHQLVALLAAFTVGPGLCGAWLARLGLWVGLLVMIVGGLVTFRAVRGLQNLWRRQRGLPADAAIAVSVTSRRVIRASDEGPSGAVAIRDRPSDQLVGISLQHTSFLLMPRRGTLLRLHFSDGSTDALAIGGGSLEGLRASLRLAGITELNPDGTPTPPVERTARPGATVPASAGGLRWVLCVVLAGWGFASFYLGLAIGHRSDPWAGSGFTRAHADECARQAVELLDPGAVDVRFQKTATSSVGDDDVLLFAAEVQSADGITESVRFVCTSDLGRITATRFD